MKTYFVACGTRVKIGKSKNPASRIASLQTASSQTFQTLLVLDGDRERELHERFAKYRVRGEWFDLSWAIREFVAAQNGSRFKQSFYSWLFEQRDRNDDIGRLAVVAISDPRFPTGRLIRMHVLLDYGETPTWRSVMKRACREWRKATGRLFPTPKKVKIVDPSRNGQIDGVGIASARDV